MLVVRRMKSRSLFLIVAAILFAPLSVSAVDVSITSLPAALPGFHAVFTSGTILGYLSAESGVGSGGTPFTVTLGTSYDVRKNVGGPIVVIGSVVWNESPPMSGIYVPTYTPN